MSAIRSLRHLCLVTLVAAAAQGYSPALQLKIRGGLQPRVRLDHLGADFLETPVPATQSPATQLRRQAYLICLDILHACPRRGKHFGERKPVLTHYLSWPGAECWKLAVRIDNPARQVKLSWEVSRRAPANMSPGA